jgi:glycosyltransferase involved in cell wall biosynthesis
LTVKTFESDALVSIAINNYNYGHFLGEAIDSALQQTYANTEVIVVDDGSTDNSREVIARYDDKVTAVLKQNGGQASAFTAGFENSKGDIVIFLDSDDMLLPHAAESSIAKLDNNEAVKLHWPLWVMDRESKKTGRRLPAYSLAEGNLLEEVIRYGVPRGWKHGLGHAYRRSFLESVMPVRDNGDGHGADSYLCALAPIFGPILSSSQPLGLYRTHGENFAAGRNVRYRLERDARRYEFLFKWVGHYLKQQGYAFDETNWYAADSAYSWTRNALALIDELAELIVPGEPLILVDDGRLGTDFIPCARPMMEIGGCYGGPPENSDAAIEELERQMAVGAKYIVFAPGTFWWLDHYNALHLYLREHFECLSDSERSIVFSLAGRLPDQPRQ